MQLRRRSRTSLRKTSSAIIGVAGSGKIDGRSKRIGSIKSDRAIEDIERRAREQTAAGEHDEADAKLNTEQDALTDSLAARSGHGQAAFMQGFALGNAQRLADGVHAANQGDGNGNGSDEDDDAPIALQIEGERHAEVGQQHVKRP